MGTKITPIQTNFNGGQFSAHLLGRVDVEKYFTAVEQMENFIPLIQGPAERRPGRRFVCPALGASRLISFQLNVSTSYILEFVTDTATNGMMAVITPNGSVLQSESTLAAPFTIGDTEIQVADSSSFNPGINNILRVGNQIQGLYSGVSGNTLTGIQQYYPYPATFPVGTVVCSPFIIFTPFGSGDDLWEMQTAQLNDVMYIVHPNHPPMKLNRLADNEWTLTYPAFHPPPMNEIPQNISQGSNLFINMGTGQAQSSSPVFIQADVGRFIVAGQGLANITVVGGATGGDPSGATTYNTVDFQLIDPYEAQEYVTGSWFVKGAPQSYFCLGVEDTSTGSKQWKSSRQLGEGGFQTAYTFTKFPQDNIAPPPLAQSFRALDVYRYIISGGAVMQIWQVVSSSEVVVQMLSPITDTYTDTNGVIRATPQSPGAWFMEDPTYGGSRGYPSAVAFFQDRLWYAGSTAEPQTMYGSVTSDYENFSKGSQDTDSLALTINNGRQDTVEFMNPFQGLLICGTLNGEYAIGAGQAVVGGNGPAITPTNATSMVQSSYGVAGIPPILVENQMLYVQRARYNVYEMAFSIYSSVLASADLNVYATLDVTSGAKELKYQQFPYRVVWLVTKDGQLWGLTYKKDDQIAGWHLHSTGYNGADYIYSVAVIPMPDASRDILYTVVARNVAGSGHLTNNIEYDDPALMTDCASQAVFDPPVGVIGGLQYLAQQEVDIVVDGTYRGKQVVPLSGQITIGGYGTGGNPVGSNIQVGLPYTSTLLTNRLADRQGPNIQGLLKSWNRLWVRVNNTLGVKINGSRQPARQPSEDMTGPVTPFTGDLDARVGPGNSREGQILVEQEQPFYCEVLAIFGQVNIGEV